MNKIKWTQHISTQQQSGVSVAEYCRQHQLSPSGFYTARKELSRGDFIPVVLKDEEKRSKFEVSIRDDGAGSFEFKGSTSSPGFLGRLFSGGFS